ncbi:MAG: hypothetical protein WC260_01555 [Candidatus Pacearchaeota archaeon]
MVTYKFKIQNDIDIGDYVREFNNVIRFSYNRFIDDKTLSLSDVEKLVKSKMNNINFLDASLIKVAVNKAKGKSNDKGIVFGGYGNFIKRCRNLISKDEYKKLRNEPLMLRGSKSDNKGNRKCELRIIEDNSILLKLNKETHIRVQLPRMNKNQKSILSKVQILSEENKGCFSIEINNDYVYIIIDETLVCKEEREVIKDRILSFDLNPNYIGLSIIDWRDQDNKEVIHKEIISFKDINDIDVRGLPSTDKRKIKVNNKRKHEVFNVSKYIINLVKHYNCDLVCFEKLNMKSQNHKKGKRFNKLVNNNWLRQPFIQNLIKRCNIENIRHQEVAPQYSSFIGQINNPKDIDSVGASIELSRRGYLFNKIYKEKSLPKQDIVFPEFNIGSLDDHWKKTLKNNLNNIKSWIDLYNVFKKSKSSYRFLFSKDKFSGNSLRLFSVNSNIMLYICT